MSYLPTGGPPIIIARNGYGGRTATGLGALDKSGHEIGQAAPAPKPAAGPSTWDKILGVAKDVANAGVKIYGQQQQQVGQQAAYQQIQQPSTPSWMMPAAIGVAALGAVLILRGGGGGKRKNPGRRRGSGGHPVCGAHSRHAVPYVCREPKGHRGRHRSLTGAASWK